MAPDTLNLSWYTSLIVQQVLVVYLANFLWKGIYQHFSHAIYLQHVYWNLPYVLLCVMWIFFIQINILHILIEAVGRVSTSVKFVLENYYSAKTTTFSRRNWTLSLGVLLKLYSYVFHQSSDLTHNLLKKFN